MSAIRYHLTWLASAIVLLLVVGMVHSNSPLAVLGLIGLFGAAACATYLENKLFLRKHLRKSSLREGLRFSLWCGGLAFAAFFLASFTFLWLFALLPSALSVPMYNFWVFMTFFPTINHYLSVPVVFTLTFLLSTCWALVSVPPPARSNSVSPSSNEAA